MEGEGVVGYGGEGEVEGDSSKDSDRRAITIKDYDAMNIPVQEPGSRGFPAPSS